MGGVHCGDVADLRHIELRRDAMLHVLADADGEPPCATIPETVYFVYQMTFAIITPALITGAFADRMKFSAMLMFMTLWSLIVYSPIAHMVWEPTGWLTAAGILDFAGGTIVHINAASRASCARSCWASASGMAARKWRRTTSS
jgi:ammonia channel protein AmtB